MLESQITYLIAAAVVICGLGVLGFFLREGIVTSNIYQQGVKLYQAKDYAAAEPVLRQVIARHPSNDIARLLLGNSLLQQDQLDQAIAELQELTQRAPKNAEAQLQLGQALLKQGDLAAAIAALETAQNLYQSQRQPQPAAQIKELLQAISSQQNVS